MLDGFWCKTPEGRASPSAANSRFFLPLHCHRGWGSCSSNVFLPLSVRRRLRLVPLLGRGGLACRGWPLSRTARPRRRPPASRAYSGCTRPWWWDVTAEWRQHSPSWERSPGTSFPPGRLEVNHSPWCLGGSPCGGFFTHRGAEVNPARLCGEIKTLPNNSHAHVRCHREQCPNKDLVFTHLWAQKSEWLNL